MLIKKYKIICKVKFERVKSNYEAPCNECRLFDGEGLICGSQRLICFRCKFELRYNNSIFDLCRKASNQIMKYNYKYCEK